MERREFCYWSLSSFPASRYAGVRLKETIMVAPMVMMLSGITVLGIVSAILVTKR